MGELVDAERVRRIAVLSRIRLAEREIPTYAQELGRILSYVKQLDELDTRDVSPIVHPFSTSNMVRSDTPQSGLPRDAALANAPLLEGAFFRVPPVLGSAAGGAGVSSA